MVNDASVNDGQDGFALQRPAVKGAVGGFAGGGFSGEGPFEVGIEDGDVGVGAFGEGSFFEVQKLGGADGEFLDDGAEAEALGVVKSHEAEGEFGFEAGDAKGGVIEFDFFLVVGMGGVIAAQDFQGSIH